MATWNSSTVIHRFLCFKTHDLTWHYQSKKRCHSLPRPGLHTSQKLSIMIACRLLSYCGNRQMYTMDFLKGSPLPRIQSLAPCRLHHKYPCDLDEYPIVLSTLQELFTEFIVHITLSLTFQGTPLLSQARHK